jgi:hypothetical protein
MPERDKAYCVHCNIGKSLLYIVKREHLLYSVIRTLNQYKGKVMHLFSTVDYIYSSKITCTQYVGPTVGRINLGVFNNAVSSERV